MVEYTTVRISRKALAKLVRLKKRDGLPHIHRLDKLIDDAIKARKK